MLKFICDTSWLKKKKKVQMFSKALHTFWVLISPFSPFFQQSHQRIGHYLTAIGFHTSWSLKACFYSLPGYPFHAFHQNLSRASQAGIVFLNVLIFLPSPGEKAAVPVGCTW